MKFKRSCKNNKTKKKMYIKFNYSLLKCTIKKVNVLFFMIFPLTYLILFYNIDKLFFTVIFNYFDTLVPVVALVVTNLMYLHNV